MLQPSKKRIMLLIGLCLVSMQLLPNNLVTALPSDVERLAGSDRYQTAVAISRKGWQRSDYAVIARGDLYADALCAVPLAHQYQAPILLTQPLELNIDTLAELKRLRVTNVFIIGGPGAVSSQIESSLRSDGIKDIERVYGQNRVETSVAIAKRLATNNKAVLAAASNSSDALSISVMAAKLRMPILLTKSDALPDEIKDYLQQYGIKQTYIIGGSTLIAEEMESKVPGPIRLAGKDRFETNIASMKYFEGQLSFDTIYIATGGGAGGNEFSDALAGSVLAAKTSSPLFLVDSELSLSTRSYLRTRLALNTKIVGLGGEAVNANSLLQAISVYKEDERDNVNYVKYDKAGIYGPLAGIQTIEGNVMISAGGITLQNCIITGELYLSESIGDGQVTLKNVTIKKRTVVNGGGEHSIYLYDFQSPSVIVNLPEQNKVRLVAQGLTGIGTLFAESNCILEEFGLHGQGFTEVTIRQGVEVTLIGYFEKVAIDGKEASLTIPSGSKVDELLVNAAASILGVGTISTARIKAEGCKIEAIPATIIIADGISAYIGGYEFTSLTPTPPSASTSEGDSFSGGSPITAHKVTALRTNTADGYYGAGTVLVITIAFKGEVEVRGSPVLRLSTGETERTAAYAGGTGTAFLAFEYEVQPGDSSPDLEYKGVHALDLNNGSIKNKGTAVNADTILPEPGGLGSLGGAGDIAIDTKPPQAIHMNLRNEIPGNGFATLTAKDGPLSNESWLDILEELRANIGGGNNWITGIEPNSLIITPAPDGGTAVLRNNSPNTATIKANFTIPAAKAKDKAGNQANHDITIEAHYLAVTVSGINSTTPDGFYKAGTSIQIMITFSDPVTVTGSPALLLETGTVDRLAGYTGGTGTNTITFVYNVEAEDTSADLDYTGTDALILNGGSLKEIGAQHNADLTLPAPGGKGSLSSIKNIVIDTTAPTAIHISAQNSIPKKGRVTLTVSEGPLTHATWINIYVQIRNNIANGKWIRGITYLDLAFSQAADGYSMVLENKSNTTATIVSDFVIPAAKVIDRAGNVALQDITIDAAN